MLLTPDEPTVVFQAARPMLRHWFSSWSGSVLFHGAAVCCFVAVAESGPRAWPVVKGRSSVASAPALDARAGGLLARVAESADFVPVEISPRLLEEAQTIPPLDQRALAETVQKQATDEAAAEILTEFSTIVRQHQRDVTDQSELQRITAQADRPTIQQTELNRLLEAEAKEPQEPPGSKEEPAEKAEVAAGQATREGDSKQDSKAATGSAASRGADENEQPIKLASNPDPEYPEEAKADRLQGRVVLSIRVGVDGRVESLKVSRSSGVKSMDESAMRTVKDWRFEPAKRFGRPIVMEIRHAIRFEFQED